MVDGREAKMDAEEKFLVVFRTKNVKSELTHTRQSCKRRDKSIECGNEKSEEDERAPRLL